MPSNLRAILLWMALALCAWSGACASASAASVSGEPLLQRFTPADFKATPYLFGIAGDGDGRIYVGNNDGVLRMQGREWQTIPLPGGMAAYALARGGDGRVYLAGYDSFGVIETAADGRAVYRDLRDAFGLKGTGRALGWMWQVLPVDRGVYFVSQRRLLFYSFDGKHRQWPLDLGDVQVDFSAYHDRLYTQRKESGLLRFDDGRLLPVTGGELLLGHTGAELLDQGDSALVVSINGFFQLHDAAVSALDVPPMPAAAGVFASVHALPDHGFVVGTVDGQLLEYDAGAHLREQHALARNSIVAMDYDADGGLWATTEDELVRLQLPSPWTRINVADLGGVVGDCEWHRDALWLAVGSRGLARIRDADGAEKIDWIPTQADRQIFGLTSTENGLFVAHAKGLDLLDDDDRSMSIIQHGQPIYEVLRSRFDPDIAYAPGDEGVYVLRRGHGKWTVAAMLPAPELASQSVVETAAGVLWVNNTRGLPERWTIDSATGRMSKREHFRFDAPGRNVDIGQGAHVLALEGKVYMTVGTEAYVFNGSAFVPFSGPPFSYMQSPNAFNTLETPVGTFAYTGSKLYRRDNDGSWKHEDFGALPAASQSVLRYGNDGVLRLSAWRALLQYRPGPAPASPARPLAVRLTEVDRVHADGKVDRLPVSGQGADGFQHDEALNLHFSVFTAEPGVEYRYRAPGVVESFTDWREQASVGFGGLDQPGQYLVEVQARTPSGRIVQPLRFAYSVAPRWYQVALVRLLAALALLIALWMLVRWRERRQVRRFVERQQKLEAMIAERTSELEVANRKLEELATEDSLTGVDNRRALESGLQREWLRCRDQRTPIALLMIDVDRFKQYNDLHGHLAGDEVLKGVADRLAVGLDPQRELLARYGGEEFCLLLPDVSLTAAQQRAESLRQSFEAGGSTVTVSIGVAARVPKPDDSPEALMRAADQMLYEAKRRGRNRVEVATE